MRAIVPLLILGGAAGVAYGLRSRRPPRTPVSELVARHVEGAESTGRRSLVLDSAGLWADGERTTPREWLAEPGSYDLWIQKGARTSDYNDLWRKLRGVETPEFPLDVVELDDRK